MPVEQRRKKILHLITSGNAGGAQTHVYDLATNLRQQYDIHVAMGTCGPLWNKLQQKDIPVYRVPGLVRPIAPYNDARCVLQMCRVIKNIKPDLICTHSSKAGLLGRLAARLCGIPAIFTAHGWAFTEGVPGWQRRFFLRAEQLAARWVAKIICVSEYDRQLAIQNNVGHSTQLVTIHNGVADIASEYRPRSCGLDPVRLIMVARFSEQKDHGLLLQALAALPEHCVFQVDLVGDGPLRGKFEKMAEKMGLGQKVNFMGSRDDVPELLAKAHIFLLVSQWEGFPISILEAMQAGLPVISTDVGGVNEAVVDKKTGFLVPRNDVAVLINRLQSLIENPGLRLTMGQKGFARYREKFSLSFMLDKTVAVYNQVLKPG